MRWIGRVSSLALWGLLTSCVTVNIYFPAAEAETAARSIVRDVMGEGAAAPKPVVPQDPGNRLNLLRNEAEPALGLLALNAFIGTAQAEANLNINTPAVSALTRSLRERNPQLAPYFRSGVIGLSRDARVVVRDNKAIPLRERTTVKTLLEQENADRDALYRELARANGHPEWESNIRDTFSRVWVQEALAGTWYEDSSGAWQQK